MGNRIKARETALLALLAIARCWSPGGAAASQPAWLESGSFKWRCGPPVLSAPRRPPETCYSIKDPSIVRYAGQWHLFCTIRAKERSHRIEYLRFSSWDQTREARRFMLHLTNGYFCAPQVFFFQPQRRWYMILQVIDKSRKPSLQPAFSTTTKITDPESWSEPRLLFEKQPARVKQWIDFWAITSDGRTYLFFTSHDGRLWRASTDVRSFPKGWSEPQVALRADIFEAAHIYRLAGLKKFLAIIEARGPEGRRYYKAFTAERLDGKWRPLAASWEKPFASQVNVIFTGRPWTDSFSHGELLRCGFDQRLAVDPENLRFLFQGVSTEGRRGVPYGRIPWRLGLLEPLP